MLGMMILSGWKETAQYLRCGVRSARRWQSRGLPVKRLYPARRAPVFANSEEIDASMRGGHSGSKKTLARNFSSCPSDSISRWTPCPPESILWPTTHYRRLWIWRPSFEHQRDFNPPEQRAAQRTHIDLSEARGLELFRVVREGIGITRRLSARWALHAYGILGYSLSNPSVSRTDPPLPEQESSEMERVFPETLKRLASSVCGCRSLLPSSTVSA
jgi:hypothetical protein